MVSFQYSEEKVWCGLNVSPDCKGMLGLEDCFMDDQERQLWDVCRPCAAQESLTHEKLLKLRRTDTW